MFLNKLFFKNSERGKYSAEERVLANIQLLEKKHQGGFLFVCFSFCFKYRRACWPVIWKLEEAIQHTHTSTYQSTMHYALFLTWNILNYILKLVSKVLNMVYATFNSVLMVMDYSSTNACLGPRGERYL